MNLTSPAHTNNRWKTPRTDNTGGDGSTKIDYPNKEPGCSIRGVRPVLVDQCFRLQNR